MLNTVCLIEKLGLKLKTSTTPDAATQRTSKLATELYKSSINISKSPELRQAKSINDMSPLVNLMAEKKLRSKNA